MKLFKSAAIGIAALSFSFSSPASAYTTAWHHMTYYSDATKTEVVGYSTVWCDHTSTGNGYPTPYYDEVWYECP